MKRKPTPIMLSIDTSHERAAYFAGATGAYTFPVQLNRKRPNEIDFAKSYADQDFSSVGSLKIEIIEGNKPKAVQMPKMILRGIAGFIQTARWGTPDCHCMSFAWAACGTDTKGLEEMELVPVKETELDAGDLIAVGKIEKWLNLDFANMRTIAHWGIYLDNNIALNVVGRGGMLTGTPIDQFDVIYPRTEVYKVENYEQKAGL